LAKKQLKVYGTRKRGHRERWKINGKGVYKEVRRDKEGRFISVKDWSPKNPISESVRNETQPLTIQYSNSKEALAKVRETVKEWEWITPMKVKS
jgi:hypothetical protein